MFFSLCVALVGAAAPRGLHRGKRACTARTACALNMSMPVLALGLVASRRPVLKWHGRAVKHRGPSGLRGNLASPCHPVFVYLLAACSTPQCVWAAPSGLRAFLEATDGILRVAPDSFEVGPGASFLPRPCTEQHLTNFSQSLQRKSSLLCRR